MNERIVFMGSPEFSIPSLRALVEKYEIVGVVTQPDRPAGRGRAMTPPPIKLLAKELGLDIIQPRRMSDADAMEQLRVWNPVVIVVAAFGQILKSEVLDLPLHGCLNVHGSLLPRWRGAAPINAAILHGDKETGVTIMRLDPGVDTGPIISQRSIEILPTDTASSLSSRLAVIGAELLVETLPGYLCGDLKPQPQDESLATYATMLKKEDGLLVFDYSAEELAQKVRAYNPWPSAYTLWQGQVLKVHRAHPVEEAQAGPGETVIFGKMPAFGTTRGLLVLDEVQPAGRKVMSGEVFLRGARDWES
ncbi:MAG: methionyl-tRNA formyltransferase [Chloroflexi bacterium]|nr:MAG: methionyl-tRNA formyltransferase [Chloroflexota bacterium]